VTEKFIGYFRLVDASPQDGCPVCRCVEEDGRRHLDAIMYEQVNDPDTRHRLHASWGFCNWHTWTLLEVPNAASGAAIIYEDLIRVFLHRIRRLRDRAPSLRARSLARLFRRRLGPAVVELHRRRKACPVCAWCAEAETGYLLTLLRFVDDPQFARAYAQSKGICAPHLLAAVELGAGTPGLARLLNHTIAKWEELRKDLDRFISKHDYRNQAGFTEAEASSYRHAFEMLSGRRGVQGNDLHGLAAGIRRGARPRAITATDSASEPETDAFEQRKLELRVTELTAQLNESMSRAAALHYRLSRVAEDRDALDLNLSGERGANELAMRTIADLRGENERLRAELAAARGASLAGPRREA
jgi:hypothetical protein